MGLSTVSKRQHKAAGEGWLAGISALLLAGCRSHRRQWTLATAAICAFLPALPVLAAAQDANSQPKAQVPQVIQSIVRRVVVDVVVADSQGKPARGLSGKDFSVYEDGAPQQILSFDIHSSASDAEFVPPHLPPLPPNSFVNLPSGPERGPLFVILLDLLHTPIDDQPRARKQLQDFISAKPEGARFAIFALTDTLHLIQGFTEDRDRLFAAVSPRTSHLPHIFIYGDNFRYSASSIGALIDIGRFLSGLSGRKNLIWIAGDFPYFYLPQANPDGALTDSSSARAATASGYSTNSLAVDEMKAAIDTLARAQTAVYTLDARGVVVGVPGHLDALNASYMVEDSIAAQTGGHAFYSNNDLTGTLAEVADTGANYYTLTYSPPSPDDGEKLRHIKVETSRRGLSLSYRRSYYLQTPDSPLLVASHKEQDLLGLPGVIQPGNSLYANMQHGAPIAHDLVFAAQVQRVGEASRPTAEQISNLAQQPAYFKGIDKKPDKSLSKISLQTYAIDFRISPAQLAPAPVADLGQSTTLELAAIAFDQDGLMLNGIVQKADITPLAQKGRQVFRIREQLDVPANAAWLRFAVRDNSTGRIGATEIPLPLPLEAGR